MLALALAVAFQEVQIDRDPYGVPIINAPSAAAAFEAQGYACAQDRLWQMENSRRLARGQMSEVFGPNFRAADVEVAKTFYTDQELKSQFEALSPVAQEAVSAYARGVNRRIADGKLPSGYASAGFKPEPWTEIDSMAISVRLFQEFGKGGAGEIRNLAMLKYLESQPNAKGRALDVLDDLAWSNDPRAVSTVHPTDDPIRSHPRFFTPTREFTERHLKALPSVGLFDLMPAIRLAERAESHRVAELVNAPFKVGSYAIVVSGKRSASGNPLLLSAPQMGHRTPSVVHEVSIKTPSWQVQGMDIPGVPGVAIGATSNFAWGLTSGVNDTDDLVVYSVDKEGRYLVDKKPIAFTSVVRSINTRGEAPLSVEQKRTTDGPVILQTKGGVAFARRSSYWMKEAVALDSLLRLYNLADPDLIEQNLAVAPMSFNFFYATRTDIGYRYTGAAPVRADALDPRLPTPGGKAGQWRGILASNLMPRVRNPQGGLLANWNNKPVSWWPNFDTPTWGRVFRNSSLLEELQGDKLSMVDLQKAAWSIARKSDSFFAFAKYWAAVATTPDAMAYNGWELDGEPGPVIYRAWLDALRDELFLPITGNFLSADTFRTAIQPSVILAALEKRSKVDYLGLRTVDQVCRTAMEKAVLKATGLFGAPPISVPGDVPIPYSNRGTYIQILEMGSKIRGRNVVSPGVSEEGPHSRDQVDLARAWLFKPMTGL
jgi:penicillin amidase